MPVFDIQFLPAKYGDSIWVSYGETEALHHILIDGGTGGTKEHIKALLKKLPGRKHIELLVVTHIDRDHIEGILSLLQEDILDFTVGEVWFNGWPHLPGNDGYEQFGAVQGEKLTAAILKHKLAWNKSFGGNAIVIPDKADLPEVILPGGMKIRLLSPAPKNLQALKVNWVKELMNANLDPLFGVLELTEDDEIEVFGMDIPDIEMLLSVPFDEDDSPANGSSIAFLASYEDKTVLFAGDSFPSLLLSSLNKLSEEKIRIDLVKLAHHGSASNTSPSLFKKLDCKKFVISTNGSIYKHPSQITIARLLKYSGPKNELIFNYQSVYNKCWDVNSLKEVYRYQTIYPEKEGITVNLL